MVRIRSGFPERNVAIVENVEVDDEIVAIVDDSSKDSRERWVEDSRMHGSVLEPEEK